MNPLLETDDDEDYVRSWSGTIEGIPTDYWNSGFGQATQLSICPDPLVGVFIGHRGYISPVEFNVFTPTFSVDSPPRRLYAFRLAECTGDAGPVAFTCPLARGGNPALVLACGLDRELNLVDIFERKHCGVLMPAKDIGYVTAVASKDSLVAAAVRPKLHEDSSSIVLITYQDGEWTRSRRVITPPIYKGWFQGSLTIQQVTPFPRFELVSCRPNYLVSVRLPDERFQQFIYSGVLLAMDEEVKWMHLSPTVCMFIQGSPLGITCIVTDGDHKPIKDFADMRGVQFGGAAPVPHGGFLVASNKVGRCPDRFTVITTAKGARMANMSALRVAWIGVVVRGMWRRKLWAATTTPLAHQRRTKSRLNAP